MSHKRKSDGNMDNISMLYHCKKKRKIHIFQLNIVNIFSWIYKKLYGYSDIHKCDMIIDKIRSMCKFFFYDEEYSENDFILHVLMNTYKVAKNKNYHENDINNLLIILFMISSKYWFEYGISSKNIEYYLTFDIKTINKIERIFLKILKYDLAYRTTDIQSLLSDVFIQT